MPKNEFIKMVLHFNGELKFPWLYIAGWEKTVLYKTMICERYVLLKKHREMITSTWECPFNDIVMSVVVFTSRFVYSFKLSHSPPSLCLITTCSFLDTYTYINNKWKLRRRLRNVVVLKNQSFSYVQWRNTFHIFREKNNYFHNNIIWKLD